MQTSNLEMPRDEYTMPEYLYDKNYRSLVPLCLILMFAIVFYLINVIVDTFIIDKEKHVRLARSLHDYLWRKQHPEHQIDDTSLSHSDHQIDQTKKLNAKYQRELEFTTWSHRNLQISLIHSCVCSIWLTQQLVAYPGLLLDLMDFKSWDSYVFLTFTCGYFLYDFYDMWSNGFTRKNWVVCLHHWIVLFSFFYHLANVMNIGYTVAALLMEINSVFLHGRKLLKFYQYPSESLLMKTVLWFNVVSFVICRFGVLLGIYTGMAVDYDRFSKRHGKTYALIYLSVLSTLTILMTIINVVLFKRILVADVLKKKKKTSVVEEKSAKESLIANKEE